MHFRATLRAAVCVRRRILTVQVSLLGVAGQQFSVLDYGYPDTSANDQPQVYEGHLPAIKKTKESILAASPKKGPSMHDTPPKPM